MFRLSLTCFQLLRQKTIKADFKAFGRSLSDKWQATCQRNLSRAVSGPNGLWKQAIVLDPFLKRCQPQSIENYTQLFDLVTDVPTVKDEFHQYLLEPEPGNPDLTALEYWCNVKQLYPHLSQAALELLCISTESVDVERSSSKLRKLQHPTRSSMSEETQRMLMTLYYNQDIQEHFYNYV